MFPRRSFLATVVASSILAICGAGGCSEQPASKSAAPSAANAPGKGTGSATQPAGAASAAGAADVLRIGVIPKGTIHEFWRSVEAGAKDAGKELGVEILWDGPRVETAHDEQRRILENMLGRGAKGIVIAPTDRTALRRPVESAVQGGVPVVVFDSNLDGDAYVSFVATDNRKGGALAAEAVLKATEGTPRRMLLLRYTEGSGSTRLREAGFEDAVKAAGGTVVESQFTDGTTEGALTTATNMLERHVKDGKLEIDGIFACNQPTSIGMMRALDRLAKQGVVAEPKFVGFDASDELAKGVRSGALEGLVLQDPYRMGRLAVTTMVKHLRGEPVERNVDTGVTLVTRDNLGDAAIRTLLGLKD
ncbi:MAG: substrate-binding domain-containing protein [Phycisphaerales bacterium]